jgi:hypothetical protein
MSKKARPASTAEPARLVEEIARLEAVLEGNPSWVAWRQLEEKMATGQGPEPQIVGALAGAYAMALAADPNYIAFLKARYEYRQLAERPGGSPTSARTKAPPAAEAREERAVTILPASHFPPPEPEPLRPAPRPQSRDATAAPIDAEWVPAPAPPAPTPAPAPRPAADSENARSLLARLTELERQATIVEEAASPIVTPAARDEAPAIEEAEVTIVLDEADDAPPAAASGLVSRLESLSRERTAGGRAAARPKTEVEEASLEIVEDPVEKG